VAWSSNVIKAGIIDHSPSGILKLNRSAHQHYAESLSKNASVKPFKAKI